MLSFTTYQNPEAAVNKLLTTLSIYPVQLVEADFHKLDKQRIWCEMAEVTATPTMLLNGYRLSDLYQLPDLKYMLE